MGGNAEIRDRVPAIAPELRIATCPSSCGKAPVLIFGEN